MIHKEGTKILLISAIGLVVLNLMVYHFLPTASIAQGLLGGGSVVLYGLILQFFRNPTRKIPKQADHIIYAPADGKVVVIEEVMETEYFNDKRLQISIFMSPLNVHVNRNPVSGIVKLSKYHKGKYLVAWHPKSSTENERTTVVINNQYGDILMRQIAGAVARRIINYLKAGDKVVQGEDMGFIRFGSRVDVFLPLDADIKVKINDVIRGNRTVLAHLPQ